MEVVEQRGRVQVVVESARAPMGCLACGALVGSHGRRDVVPVDVPCFGRLAQLVWRKRTWRCAEAQCTGKAFTEHEDLHDRRLTLLEGAPRPQHDVRGLGARRSTSKPARSDILLVPTTREAKPWRPSLTR